MYSYSQRLSWPIASNDFTKRIAEKRRLHIPLLDLTVSNPTQAFADYPHSAISRVYAGIEDFTYQPDPLGLEQARLAVAQYYEAREIRISPERILLTSSTSEAYALLFKLFCNPGDEILAPLPSYPLFEYLASLESINMVPYRMHYDGSWFADFAGLRRAVSERTRAIVVVNPNNPTGSFWKREEIEHLLTLAEEHRLPILADEVFMDYRIEPSEDRIPTFIGRDSVLTFSLSGLSKIAGMPQMKLAWMAINGPAEEAEGARERLELELDTYLSVGTPVQCALRELLTIGEKIQEQILKRARENFSALKRLLAGSPAHCLHTEGGWSAVIQVPNTMAEEVWISRLLDEHGVIMQPGYFFDMQTEAYLVVSLITPPGDFIEGIRRLRQLADDR